jgi:DNA-binding HxlR family transcriptional regulator
MRGHLRALTEAGILERRRRNEFPGSVDYELGSAGADLLVVAGFLRDWLAGCPGTPIELGSPAAKSAIKALVEGWSAGAVRALAARPFALTELSRIISTISYPSLERRLAAMRLAGQIERCAGGGRGTPYRVTDWLRCAIGPLAAAARWERSHCPTETSPIGKIDIESAFLLAMPLLNLPAEHSGVCRLAVESQNGNGESRLTGVMVEVERGQVRSCVARLEGRAAAWASGSAGGWLRAVIDDDLEQLELGGDHDLARSFLDGFHGVLSNARGF